MAFFIKSVVLICTLLINTATAVPTSDLHPYGPVAIGKFCYHVGDISCTDDKVFVVECCHNVDPKKIPVWEPLSYCDGPNCVQPSIANGVPPTCPIPVGHGELEN